MEDLEENQFKLATNIKTKYIEGKHLPFTQSMGSTAKPSNDWSFKGCDTQCGDN